MSINPTNYSEWTEAKAPDPCEVLSHPYPFTTYHEMSLGWFLQQWKEFLKNYEESKEAIAGITADAETAPYTEPATVIVTGGEEGKPYHLHFKIPQGEPGQGGGGDVKSVNRVTPDEDGDITLSARDIPTPDYPSIVAALAAKANTTDVADALANKVNTTDIIDVAHGGTSADNAADARQALQVIGTADALSLEEIAASTDLTGKVASASTVKSTSGTLTPLTTMAASSVTYVRFGNVGIVSGFFAPSEDIESSTVLYRLPYTLLRRNDGVVISGRSESNNLIMANAYADPNGTIKVESILRAGKYYNFSITHIAV